MSYCGDGYVFTMIYRITIIPILPKPVFLMRNLWNLSRYAAKLIAGRFFAGGGYY